MLFLPHHLNRSNFLLAGIRPAISDSCHHSRCCIRRRYAGLSCAEPMGIEIDFHGDDFGIIFRPPSWCIFLRPLVLRAFENVPMPVHGYGCNLPRTLHRLAFTTPGDYLVMCGHYSGCKAPVTANVIYLPARSCKIMIAMRCFPAVFSLRMLFLAIWREIPAASPVR